MFIMHSTIGCIFSFWEYREKLSFEIKFKRYFAILARKIFCHFLTYLNYVDSFKLLVDSAVVTVRTFP